MDRCPGDGMFGLFNRSKSAPTAGASVPSHSSGGSQRESRLATQQHTDIQRELVRVVLKDLLRAHGIPGNWLGCEVLVMPNRKRDDEVTVQLQMQQWNEQLLRHAPALEGALRKALDRFDPLVDHSRYKYMWQFGANCGCPYTELPAKFAWTAPPAEAPADSSAPANILDRRKRPRAPKGADTRDGFARTEMTALK